MPSGNAARAIRTVSPGTRCKPSRGKLIAHLSLAYRHLPFLPVWLGFEFANSIELTFNQSLFAGQGSYGNGAAMRAAPVGAYFADDLDAVVEHARRSAEVTHAHPEGIAGAIAVAAGAAWAWRLRRVRRTISAAVFLDHVVRSIPESTVRTRTAQARDLLPEVAVEHAAAMLGGGVLISAQDTVPFALWCAARHLDDYEAALWETVSGLGDRDTTCAIVGGIVVTATSVRGIPADWLARREPPARLRPAGREEWYAG